MKTILQRDFRDCGVTCLEYIIEFYHGYVPIEKLREDTFTNQKGCTAYHLVETLKKYQFDSYGEKTDVAHLKEIPLPAILHFQLPNGMQHFVVLTHVSENHITIMDPSSGRRTLTKRELGSLWDGVVLIAVPLTFIPRIPKEKSIQKQIFHFVKQERKNIGKIFALSLGVSLITILSSFYLKIGMEYSTILNMEELKKIVLIFGVLLILKCIFSFGKEFTKIYLEQNIDVSYLFSFFTHILKLPVQKFESYHVGDLLTRMDEAGEWKELFSHVCINFLLEGTLAVFSLFILFFIEWHLALFIAIGMLIYVFLGIVTSRPFYQIIKKMMENNREMNEYFVGEFQMYESIKNLNVTSLRTNEAEECLCRIIQKNTEEKKYALFYNTIKEYFLELLLFGITTYGIFLIGNQQISIYDFLVFQNLYLYFISPFKELTDLLPKFYYMKGITSKLGEMLAIPEEVCENTSLIPVPSIQIDHLTYSYNDVVNQIEDVSFKVKAKEHIFLDGPSGCGKSTVCKILHKDLKDYMGKITFLEKDLEDYTLSEIRNSVLYLSQKEQIQVGTIEENILFGEVKSERFDEVCRVCEIESIVAKKPLRYQSIINETMVSGGEKQRIMLARTIMKEGSVYLFDEALSEVEEEMEERIITNLRKFLKGKTLIYISHKDHSSLFERRVFFANKKSIS